MCSVSTCIHAHEYWLDPITPVVKSGNDGLIDIKIGEDFSGAAYPYDPERFKSISITGKQNSWNYTGRLGDYPAIRPNFTATGIHSIAVETNPQKITYSSWENFTEFLDYHGFTDVMDRHIERNLPKIDVTESYTRSAKTLVRVQTATSQKELTASSNNTLNSKAFDTVGHEFEMVLLESPFNDAATVRLKLLFQGKPLGHRQVEMFWKGDGTARITNTTNADGIATFELLVEGDYLMNAVQLSESKNSEAHWASYWASITFEHRKTNP